MFYCAHHILFYDGRFSKLANKTAFAGNFAESLFCKKNAAESHPLLVELYGEHALSYPRCKEWFARFKSADYDIKGIERPGQPKKFEDKKLETLLDKDSNQTQEELAESLGVTHTAILKHLKAKETTSCLKDGQRS